MRADLKTSIRKALAGSSGQQPVDIGALYQLGTRKQVQAALLELYQAREVCCCLYQRGGKDAIVWWLTGGVSAPHSYGRVAA